MKSKSDNVDALVRHIWGRGLVTSAEKQQVLTTIERVQVTLFTHTQPAGVKADEKAVLEALKIDVSDLKAAKQTLAAAREALVRLSTLRLEVARALTSIGEERVLKELSEHILGAMVVEFRVRPQLVAGAVFTLGGKRWDGSWARKLAEGILP